MKHWPTMITNGNTSNVGWDTNTIDLITQISQQRRNFSLRNFIEIEENAIFVDTISKMSVIDCDHSKNRDMIYSEVGWMIKRAIACGEIDISGIEDEISFIEDPDKSGRFKRISAIAKFEFSTSKPSSKFFVHFSHKVFAHYFKSLPSIQPKIVDGREVNDPEKHRMWLKGYAKEKFLCNIYEYKKTESRKNEESINLKRTGSARKRDPTYPYPPPCTPSKKYVNPIKTGYTPGLCTPRSKSKKDSGFSTFVSTRCCSISEKLEKSTCTKKIAINYEDGKEPPFEYRDDKDISGSVFSEDDDKNQLTTGKVNDAKSQTQKSIHDGNQMLQNEISATAQKILLHYGMFAINNNCMPAPSTPYDIPTFKNVQDAANYVNILASTYGYKSQWKNEGLTDEQYAILVNDIANIYFQDGAVRGEIAMIGFEYINRFWKARLENQNRIQC